MAYQTPKTDWTESYTPSPSDMNRIEGNVLDNRAEMNRIEGNVLDNRAEMNRIEGNVLDNRAEIVQEVIDRTTSVGNEEAARIAADGVLQSYVDSQVAIEASARIAGDATKISSSELIGRVYTAVSTTTNRTDILPAGLYYVKCNSSTSLAVRDSGGIWRTIIKSPQGIMAISDGANIQMSATPPMGSTAGWEAIKIS